MKAVSKLFNLLCIFLVPRSASIENFTNYFLRDLKARPFFSFSFRLTQAGQAHVLSVSMASHSLAL